MFDNEKLVHLPPKTKFNLNLMCKHEFSLCIDHKRNQNHQHFRLTTFLHRFKCVTCMDDTMFIANYFVISVRFIVVSIVKLVLNRTGTEFVISDIF